MQKDHNKPTPDQMTWIEQNCGDKPCQDICGKLGVWHCPLK